MQAYLDRRLSGTSPGVRVAWNPAFTRYTLPYTVLPDGSEGQLVVVRQATGEICTGRHLSPNLIEAEGVLEDEPVWIGVLYDFIYTPTRLFYRDQQDIPDTAGRLQLRYIEVEFSETTGMTVRVDLSGRGGYSKTLAAAAPSTGALRLAVPAQNTQATLKITDRSPGPLRLVGLEWEGFLAQRSRRA